MSMFMLQVLEAQSREIPELNELFLNYKALKKKIKAIPIPPSHLSGGELFATSAGFVCSLSDY
jgi:hypothetical protein